MLRRFLVLLLTAWMGLSILNPAANADPVFPPGLRIGLEPQAGLTVSKQFPGFEDADNKVAVTMLDVPARAYEELERSAFAKSQPGLTDTKRESFPFTSGIGFLISGQATDSGIVLHKWFLLATSAGGAADLAMLINVQVPEAARTVYSDAVIRKMLASVTFRPPPLQEQLSLLPFKFNDLAGFKVMQALPEGAAILADGSTDDPKKQSSMIVSVGRAAPAEPDQRGKFARELLSAAPLRDLTVTLAEPMRIGGAPGYEVRAQGNGLDGVPVTVVQWVRFGSGGFLRIVGVSRKDDWDALFTRFRAVRDGIEFR